MGNVGEVSRVSERDGEAFVANFPLATNEVWRDKEGNKHYSTEIVCDNFLFLSRKSVGVAV